MTSLNQNNRVITYVITYLLTLSLIPAGLFYYQNVQAASHTIVISEVMAGEAGESQHEYVKLYNLSSGAIDLDGWSLKKKTKGGTESNLVSSTKMTGTVAAGGYFIIAHPEYSSAVNADLEYSGSSYSFAGHNTILIYDENGDLIDKLGFGDAGDYEGAPADNPASGEKLIRIGNQDSDDNSADFQISGTGQADDSGDTVDIPADVEVGEVQVSTSSKVIEREKKEYFRTGSILINELVSDPEDDEEEWVELFNNTSDSIDLNGWYLEISSGARTYLVGSIGLDEENYILIVNLVGSLKNLGDEISLRDLSGNVIDRVVYGDFDDGYVDDNALAAPDPMSLARLSEKANTLSDNLNYLPVWEKTPGAQNLISNEILKSADCLVKINELMPWAEEKEDEFVEVACSEQERLENYYLKNISGQIVVLFGDINLDEFIKFEFGADFVMLNTGDTIKLYRSDDALCQVVEYSEAKINESYAYDSNSRKFAWSLEPSPGAANKIVVPNQAPVVNFSFSELILARPILFDSGDTFDPEGDELEYKWDFGDGFSNILKNPEHTFFSPGEYEVVLAVSDGELIGSSSRKIIIKDRLLDVQCPITENFGKSTVVITEVLPNPEGADSDGEWLELFNFGSEPVNLFGWSVDDGQGGSKPFEIGNLMIEPQNYIVLEREETKLAFNNSSDTVRLIDGKGQEVASTTYQGGKEGLSWAQGDDGEWAWSTTASPGARNEIKTVNAVKASANTASRQISNQTGVQEVSLAEISELPLGSKVKTRGTVAVLPGVFAKQYFYITGSPGIQVYSYKQDFPDLKIGDKVAVTGELSQNQGETRIKTVSASDIAKDGGTNKLAAMEINCSEVEDCRGGELIKVRGELIEAKGANLYLDDGEGEVLVYIKSGTGINAGVFSEGDEMEVSGILVNTQNGKRLQPRGPEDINLLNKVSDEPEVLGVDSGGDWSLGDRKSRLSLYLIFLIIFVTLAAVLLFIKLRKQIN